MLFDQLIALKCEELAKLNEKGAQIVPLFLMHQKKRSSPVVTKFKKSTGRFGNVATFRSIDKFFYQTEYPYATGDKKLNLPRTEPFPSDFPDAGMYQFASGTFYFIRIRVIFPLSPSEP